MALFQYQVLAAPPAVIVAAATLAWTPCFPDRAAPPPRTLPIAVPQATFTATLSSTPTQWAPTYPNLVRQSHLVIGTQASAPQVVALVSYAISVTCPTPLSGWLMIYKAVTAPSPLPIAGTDQYAWRPEFPDLGVSLRAPEFAAFATGATSSALPVAALSWEPEFADFATAARRSVEFTAFSIWPQPIPVTTDSLGWRGSFPDRHTYLRPAEFSPFATGAVASALPVAALSWSPVFADLAPAARRAAEYPAFAFDPMPFTISVDQMGWRGVSADWIARRLPAEHPAFATGSTASSLPAASLSWQPEFSDGAPGPRRAGDFMAFALWPQPLAGTPAMSWQGTWPDWLARLAMPRLESSVLPAFPATVPQLASWLPTLPGPGIVLPRPLAQDLALPWPQATVPLLDAWRGAYPDLVASRAATPDTSRVDRVSFTAVVPTYFSATYPDLLLPAGRTNGGRVEIPDWEVLRPASPTRAWAPTWPDFARGKRPVPVGGMPSWSGPLAYLSAGPSAAQFVLQLAIQPTVTNELAVQPATTTELATQPLFGGEKAVIQ